MSRTTRAPKKSPSERLRGVFYQLYLKQQPIAQFEDWYEEKMEALIEHYKNILTKQK
jgi:hypothetical protein